MLYSLLSVWSGRVYQRNMNICDPVVLTTFFIFNLSVLLGGEFDEEITITFVRLAYVFIQILYI